ncbi:MAG: TlpA disulfide reductase family protein [Candidatus Poribacteria bacterium]|nr:TlpA disulfide reductase family protein [Candidatus Poribacteria bacterium]
MKAILTVTMILSLLMASANADTPAEKPSEDVTEAQSQKNMEICKQHFREIRKAIQAYKKDHGDFPKWLSDLHPKYLPDANLLLCPADNKGGKPIFRHNTDPKMPVSYGYRFWPEVRALKNEERLVYGDIIPLFRCLHHHFNEDGECLNLSFSLKIYESRFYWRYTPEDMYGSPEAAITTFEKALARYPDDRRFFDLYPTLVTLYTKVENEKSADAMIERLKSAGMIPDDKGYRSVSEILAEAGLYEELLEIFKAAEQRQPDAEIILGKLAYIYRKLGNTELSEVYERKVDPKYKLWGKLVPDFSATDLDGKPISLKDYRGKVILLDFWAVWCGFCIDEMPNLKKVYATYKDQGFDIIGVSLDDTEKELRDYIKENNIQWRQIFDTVNAKSEDSLVRQLKITSVPSQWLIDRDGKLITHKARGEKLEQLVVDALKKKAESK